MEETGPIDAARFLSFVWRAAGRPEVAPEGWKRVRPLVLVLDNYSVHVGQVVRAALPSLVAANVHLFYLPSYSPELSAIEPVWQAVKHHEMPIRSFAQVRDLKSAVEEVLSRKADALQKSQPAKVQPTNTQSFRTVAKTTNLLRLTA